MTFSSSGSWTLSLLILLYSLYYLLLPILMFPRELLFILTHSPGEIPSVHMISALNVPSQIQIPNSKWPWALDQRASCQTPLPNRSDLDLLKCFSVYSQLSPPLASPFLNHLLLGCSVLLRCLQEGSWVTHSFQSITFLIEVLIEVIIGPHTVVRIQSDPLYNKGRWRGRAGSRDLKEMEY